MNTPPQYRFQFLFDVQNSNYIDKYILINELFKKIGNDFSQRSRQERLKFTSINYFLQKQEPVIAVTICSKDIKVKRHKHLFDILYENSEHNNSFALKAPFTLTEEDLIYFINCPGNKKQCINCPGYWLLNYENENKNFNLNIYCRLYTAIFNSLRERGQL